MSNFDHFVGTRPVSDQHAFDTAALTDWLGRHMPGFAGPLTVEMFKGGQSNPTYKLITPGASYVMRAKPGPVAKLLPSAHAIEREFAVMKGLAGTAVPVAKMHVLCDDEAIIGRAFYVMEFVQGRVLWDQALPDMTREQRRDIYLEMNRVIAALHAVAQEQVKADDPMAVAMKYVAKSTVAGSNCANCMQVQGKDGDALRGCNIFPGKLVSAEGWCAAWVKKA